MVRGAKSMSEAHIQMDFVLLEIKNFLRKLENGQLEIEAGQWELHKDMDNMKKTINELRNLKDDVEKMRLSSVEQIGIIKGLQAKIDVFKKRYENDEPATVSESKTEYETIYKRPIDGKPTGYKKRKCHVIRSEEIVEITSEISNPQSNTEEAVTVAKTDGRSQEDEEKISEQTSDCNSPRTSNQTQYEEQPQEKPSKSYYNNEILQRYLKDTAKYSDKRQSVSTVISCKTKSESEFPFWDEYRLRKPKKVNTSLRSSVPRKTINRSVISFVEKGDVHSSKRYNYGKCSEKMNSDGVKHARKRRRGTPVHFCKTCGKGFSNKEKLRDHAIVHRVASKHTRGFRCSYCHKVCPTPEKLTAHLKDCRKITRSRKN